MVQQHLQIQQHLGPLQLQHFQLISLSLNSPACDYPVNLKNFHFQNEIVTFLLKKKSVEKKYHKINIKTVKKSEHKIPYSLDLIYALHIFAVW